MVGDMIDMIVVLKILVFLKRGKVVFYKLSIN